MDCIPICSVREGRFSRALAKRDRAKAWATRFIAGRCGGNSLPVRCGVLRTWLATTAREVLGRGPGLLWGSATEDGWTRHRRTAGNRRDHAGLRTRACARKHRPETKNRRGGRAARRRAKRCSPQAISLRQNHQTRASRRPPPLTLGRDLRKLGRIAPRECELRSE
jgi:hypothetical protein